MPATRLMVPIPVTDQIIPPENAPAYPAQPPTA